MDGQKERSMLMERKDVRDPLVVIGGFAALLFWWVGLTGYISAGFGGGVLGFFVFLLVPILLSTATYLAVRREGLTARDAGMGRHRSN